MKQTIITVTVMAVVAIAALVYTARSAYRVGVENGAQATMDCIYNDGTAIVIGDDVHCSWPY